MAKTDNVTPIKPGPAEDAVKAINFAKFVRADAALAEEKGEFKSVVKHVEGKGLNVKAAAIAMKILRQGSAATQAYSALIRDVLELLNIGGSPVPKEQIEMFAGEEERTPAAERARKAGRNAAFFDKDTGDNPYDPASELGQEWLAGLTEGRSEVDLILSLEPGPDSELIHGDAHDDPFEQAAE